MYPSKNKITIKIMKKVVTFLYILSFVFTGLLAQDNKEGLRFDDAFYLRLNAENRLGINDDVLLRTEFKVLSGQVLKITSTGFGYTQKYQNQPTSINTSNHAEIFLNDCLISQKGQAVGPITQYPIWLPPGTYEVELKSVDLNSNTNLKAFISGVYYKVSK